MSAIVFIPLTQGKVAVIDFEDFEKVRPYKWHAAKRGRNFYAMRTASRKEQQRKILLHCEIMQPDEDLQVDHIDGDGLNNRRENLRTATGQQNASAFKRLTPGKSSKYRGVCRNKDVQKWQANISPSGKMLYLGVFGLEEDAARAYDAAAIKHFGEYASLNFPQQKAED